MANVLSITHKTQDGDNTYNFPGYEILYVTIKSGEPSYIDISQYKDYTIYFKEKHLSEDTSISVYLGKDELGVFDENVAFVNNRFIEKIDNDSLLINDQICSLGANISPSPLCLELGGRGSSDSVYLVVKGVL